MSLDVHLRGGRVGTLEPGSATDYSFSYAPEVVAAAGEGTVVLSHSLPVREEAFDAIPTRTFFEGLLPESARRDEIARELRIDSNDTYRLLAEIGRDCAGAIVILPSGESLEPRDGSVEWLSDEELATMIEDLPKRPLGVRRQGKMRLSLAGVQRKLTLIRSGSGAFGLPEADAPSTHLIKPQYDSEYPDLAYNEMFCMRVAGCLGLSAAETSLEAIGGRPCLISRRFDRSTDGTGTVRLHQEDLCQALGVPGNLKYERSLGPGFRRFRELLQEIGRGPDVQAMVRAAVLNFVLGNSDAHGKNFAILFAELGRQLAPLYDIVSTAVYDDLEEELAMAIGENYEPESVRLADWMDMGADCDLASDRFLKLVRETAIEVRECAESAAAAARAERWHRPVLDQIVEVAKRRSALVESEIDPR
ncbi:MAG TPA: type II toxin-antitoxin system HipA family toxin [Solirubrobacterales bacterium]|nr:type II toxin-antitoxin system HipA family toxin [Solirubrobacterales bacterium]